MDEEFIRNRITELRLKKGASEYQMSLALGQNRIFRGFHLVDLFRQWLSS